MVDDDVITHLDVLGQVRVLHADKFFVANHLLFAVQEVLLPSLDLNAWLPVFEVAKTNARSL